MKVIRIREEQKKEFETVKKIIDFKGINTREEMQESFYKNSSRIIKFTTIKLFNSCRFSQTHGALIIKEKDLLPMKEVEYNRMLQEVLFLANKRNCSVYVIANKHKKINMYCKSLQNLYTFFLDEKGDVLILYFKY